MIFLFLITWVLGMTEMTGSRKPCILIADDDAAMRHLIKLFYSAYSFELIEAANGQQAVELAREFIPDLILMDMHMPDFSGCMAVFVLNSDEVLKEIPIVVITGQELSAVEEQLGGMYAGCLNKPFFKDQLLHMTLRHLPVSQKILPGVEQGTCGGRI